MEEDDGDGGEDGDVPPIDSDSDSNSVEEDAIEYTMTKKEDWKRIGGRSKGRTIDPVPFTGEDEEFTVRISDEELKEMKDSSGDIRYERVFKWMLPNFGSEKMLITLNFWRRV